MGIFKDMKDLRETVAAVPSITEQAQQMAVNAQAMQAQAMAQQQALLQAQQAAAAPPPAEALEPIAGVSLETYARIAKALAPLGGDQSAVPGVVAAHGVDSTSWPLAQEGWNARMKAQPAVAKAFSDLYGRV